MGGRPKVGRSLLGELIVRSESTLHALVAVANRERVRSEAEVKRLQGSMAPAWVVRRQCGRLD